MRAPRPLLIGARLAVVLAALLFLARGVAWRQVAAIVRDAKLSLLLAVIALNGTMMAVKAVRLRLLLGRGTSLAVCFLAKLSASAMNNVVPLRGGDVARLWMLERHAAITKSDAAIVAVLEQLFEAVALAAMATVAATIVPGQRWAAVAAPVALMITVTLVSLARQASRSNGRRPASARWPIGMLWRLTRRCGLAARALRDDRATAIALALSLLDWVIEASMVVLCARAVGLPIDFPLAFVVLVGINGAMLLPSLPASAGAFEAGAALVLMWAGVPKDPAIAFALLYHLVQIIPVTLAGLIVSLSVGLTLGGLPVRPHQT